MIPIKISPQESLNIAGSFVAFGLVSILGFVTWALVFVAIPEANENALTLLIGILSANVGMVVGYFFGSSVNNKKQSEAIADMAKTAQAAGAALPSAPDATVTLQPGDTAKVTAVPTGDTPP